MMRFVILYTGEIPGYDVRGPVLTPQSYDLLTVLKWVSYGIDVCEVMEDGSYRQLTYNDRRLRSAIDQGKNKVVNKEPRLIDVNELMGKKEETLIEEEKEETTEEVQDKVDITTEETKDEVKEYPNADVFEGIDDGEFVVDELEESE